MQKVCVLVYTYRKVMVLSYSELWNNTKVTFEKRICSTFCLQESFTKSLRYLCKNKGTLQGMKDKSIICSIFFSIHHSFF